MNTSELAVQLEECLRLAGSNITDENKETFDHSKGELPAELSTLLQEAVEMKWPFVEEKWQYKRSVTSEDKVNTTQLIGKHLPQLLVLLRESIRAREPGWSMSVVFLLDRFFYLVDGSHTLLKIAKALHRRYPETPVAPQIVIRQARVYLNAGKLQKAEFILSSLINNSGATGCWQYQRDSDQVLVQAVSVQVRGQVLQKLGLWLEAAELFWASLIGFHVLPLPDKKGIGTSLGLLANTLISMTDEDFATLQKTRHVNLGILGDCSHRLLCAAQVAKLAAVYSQYGSLYVLTHMVTRGTCLLSYSFSKHCPSERQNVHLSSAKEAFENGLLTKKDEEVVTSHQELQTLLRAAYCLAVTNKWISGLSGEVRAALQACQEALALLYPYCFRDDSDKPALSAEVMARVRRVKTLLEVKLFANSDPRSFIPDSYRSMEDTPVPFTIADFGKVMQGFQKHHRSVCEAFSLEKNPGSGQDARHANCITAFQTRTESLPTNCPTKDCKSDKVDPGSNEIPQQVATDSLLERFQMETYDSALDSEEPPGNRGSRITGGSISGTSRSGSSLGSSWLNWSGSSWSSHVMVNPACFTEEDDANAQDEPARNAGNDSNGANSASANNPSSSDLSKNSLAGSETVNRSLNHQKEFCTTSLSEDDCGESKAAHVADASNHTSDDFSFLASASPQNSIAGSETVNKDVQTQVQTGHELCSTLESENNLPGTNYTKTRTSSGSLSGSLGSSWLSISFPRSPQSSEQAANQKCATLETDDGPDSPFEYVDAKPSASPTGAPGSSEDPEMSFLSRGVSRAALAGANGAGNRPASLPSSDSFELVQPEETPGRSRGSVKVPHHVGTEDDDSRPRQMSSAAPQDQNPSSSSGGNVCSCFQGCIMGSVVLTEQDYKSLYSGVCQACLLRRLPSRPFQLRHHDRAYSALVLKYSKSTDSWTGCETSVYVGEVLNVDIKGNQRKPFRVQYLHQELLLASYVGKDYLKEKKIHTHLSDVERQMTAQFYVMEFNKRLYENNITTQIFYIPSEILLLLESDSIVACVSVEPYMLGKFIKLTNNTSKTNKQHSTTEFGLAFGHFTYMFSKQQEVVVDLQGWVSGNGKGLMYLTDPQIHTLRKPRSANNFHLSGITKFLQDQHGECNSICSAAALHTLTTR
ncbi:alpha-protein kinase 1 [Trichomycterus rosablanca]|uniref:alpha-protein kinase 1 n=1 Tax=Trichomycterus rosablanca TaxID=2290929 RepID=UPI002F3530AF